MSNNTDIQPIAPRKFTTAEVYKHVLDNHQIRLGDASIKRILQSVNKIVSPTEQLSALGTAIDAEVAKVPKLPDAVYRLRALAPVDNLVFDLDEGPHPWFEKNRPAWSSPRNDALDDDGGTSYGSSGWRSEEFSVPCLLYCGKIENDRHRLPRLTLNVAQRLDAAPYIEMSRNGWYASGDRIPQDKRLFHKFTLDEAATLAHVLLNLVDLANEQ